MADADAGRTAYAYDSAGNLIEKIDAKNQRSEYLYDAAGQLEQINYYGAADHATPVKTVTFSYDAAGNLTGYDDGTTSAEYGYDDADRKISETVHYPGFDLTGGTTYYKNGLAETYTGPDGIAIGYLYDANNQLTGVQIPDAGMFSVNDYRWNRPAQQSLPGGTTRQYQYDSLMRTTQIAVRDPGGNQQLNYGYTYDKVDNITAKQAGQGDYSYRYDELYRLTGTESPDQADESFAYDAVGNRTASAATAGTWTYNANNELEGYDDVSFQYDANGNLIEKNAGGVITRFFYNPEDRLERVEDGSGATIATYYYDPFGRRLWKEVGGTRTCFHYNDRGLAGEYDTAGVEIKTYGWKPGSTWSTDPLFMKIGTKYYWYINDHLGTPQMMTNSSGAVVWRAKYSSFGKAIVDSSSTVDNSLRFPGQYDDCETSLHYNYFRYYDPKNGRYLSIDPIGFSYGDINQYIYVLNNTNTVIDPYGLKDTWEPTDIPCPIATPFQAHAFKVSMKMCFKRQYKKDMRTCLFNNLNDRANCRNDHSNKACDSSDGLSCNEKAKLRYIKCTLKAYQWEILYDEYSWGDALIDMYRFTEGEACQHYRRKVDRYEIH